MTLEGLGFALDARNLDLLERRKSRVRHESPASRRGSRSPEHRADSARERSPSPRRSPPFRRNSVDALAPGVFSHPGSAAGSPAAGGAAGERRLGDDSDEERDALEPGDDAAGLSPEKRNPRPSGSGKHLGLSFSIFGTRRSRRRSEANPLQKMEQAKQEVCAQGESAHAGLAFVRDRRRAAQSVGSAQELAALRRGDGRAASVSAFDGWLAAAGDGEPPRVKKEKTYGSDRGDPASSAGSSEDERSAPRARREPVKSSSPLASPREPDEPAASSPPPVTPGAAYPERVDVDAAHILASRLRELWALASADASMSTRAAVAAAAIRAVPSPFAPKGAAFPAAAAAELAATDLVGVVLALEGGGATESDGLRRGPRPAQGGHRAHEPGGGTRRVPVVPRGSGGGARVTTGGTSGGGGAQDEGGGGGGARGLGGGGRSRRARGARRRGVGHRSDSRRTRRRARRRRCRRRRGRASLLLRALGVARVASSSSSFSEHLADADPAEAEASFDPAVAVANGDVGRVLCRLPGGAALWGDVRTWRGIESARVSAVGPAASDESHEWLFHPREPPRRRRRARAAAMAATGLSPHAVSEILARLGPLPVPERAQGAARRGGADGLEDGKGDKLASRSVSGNAPETRAPRPSSSRVGRSTARVWNVPATSRARPGALAAEPAGSGPGDAVAHDGYIERARAGVSSAAAVSVRAGAGAPDWAANETTRGVGRRKPFTLALSDGYPRGDDECERDGHDENAPLFSGRFSDDDDDDHDHDEADPRAGEGARDAFSFSGDACSFSPALLPDDARRACLFAAPVTVVAVRLTCGVHARGGLVAAGSATGAFAVWDPGTGPSSARRPARGARSRRRRRRAASSRTPPSPRTVLSVRRGRGGGGGVPGLARQALERARARRDARRRRRRLGRCQGACVLANPGSHAGAVTVAAAAPGGEASRPARRRAAHSGPPSRSPPPTHPATASSSSGTRAPGRGRPRRRSRGTPGESPRVSPRWRPRGGGAGGAPGRPERRVPHRRRRGRGARLGLAARGGRCARIRARTPAP